MDQQLNCLKNEYMKKKVYAWLPSKQTKRPKHVKIHLGLTTYPTCHPKTPRKRTKQCNNKQKSTWGWITYQRTRWEVSKATLFPSLGQQDFWMKKKEVGDNNISIEVKRKEIWIQREKENKPKRIEEKKKKKKTHFISVWLNQRLNRRM